MRLLIWDADIACYWDKDDDVALAVANMIEDYSGALVATYEIADDPPFSTDTAVYEVLTDRLWDARNRWGGEYSMRWFEANGFVEGVDYRFITNVRIKMDNEEGV